MSNSLSGRATILTVFGTRPEVVKLAPVLRQLDLYPNEFRSVVVSSGQHTDLLAPFVKLFGVRIDHDLATMRPGQPLNLLAGRVLSEIDPVLRHEQPDLVLVQGDTTTAVAAAWAAFHCGIPVGHVEAGLRTDDPLTPFPEETNRRLISRLARYHFAATRRNRHALRAEGVPAESVFLTGNPVVDALQFMGTVLTPSERLRKLIDSTRGYRRIALTTHRRESFGPTLSGNLRVLRDFADEHPDVAIIFPVHPNPAVREASRQLEDHPRVFLTEPLDYPDFISLLSESWLIVSDSGGVQEEAPTLGKPLIVLREKTERPEAVEAGVARLAGTPEALQRALAEFETHSGNVRLSENPFGQGDAGQRIVQVIRRVVKSRQKSPAEAAKSSHPSAKKHILTVALEDYFQVGAFNRVIQRGQWYRFETRLEQNAERTLNLLDRHGVKATFFVLGWIADRFPELVRKVADRGHEIASKGYYHRGISGMTPAEFTEDLLRSREALEQACGRRVLGYRVADGWFTPEDLWALDVLAEAGYRYDSSIAPIGRTWSHEPFRRFLHVHESGGTPVVELPISTISVAGFKIPIAGGNYFRQFPPLLIRRAIARWDRKFDSPLVLYFHAWELDPEQPTISASSRLTRMRHYRNLHKMEGYLDYFLQRYRFTSAADFLKLNREHIEPGERVYSRPQSGSEVEMPSDEPPSGDRTPVTIVVPCYNEELILPYLSNTLASVESRLRKNYRVTFSLVDDGSQDKTWEGLQKLFDDRPGFELYRHEHNLGVAAAIMTGIRRARTEVVASIDCDCTYDPHELARMIPLLTPEVDLVTASPYHPQGGVRNVPGWRLKLSRGASWLYRRVLHHKLHTYTSCFRVYRRSAALGIDLKKNNFLGIAELLGRLDLQGSKIVEFPAVLEVRMLGRSKMKTLRTILSHLGLMCTLLTARIFGDHRRRETSSAPEPEHAVAS